MLCLTIKTLVNTSPVGRSVVISHLSVMLDTILMYPLTSLILTKNFLNANLGYIMLLLQSCWYPLILLAFLLCLWSVLLLLSLGFCHLLCPIWTLHSLLCFFSLFISFLLCFSVFFFVYVTSCVSILCFVPFQFSFAVLAVVCLGYWSAIACCIDFNCVCTFPIGFYK